MLLVIDGKAIEFSSIKGILEYVIALMATEQEKRVKEIEQEMPIERAIPAEIPDSKLAQSSTTKKENKEVKTKGEHLEHIVNSFDLPPMKRHFFPRKEGDAPLKSYLYYINGEIPKHRGADVARNLFVKTQAFLQLDKKAQEKVINHGLTFLKKQVRDTGKEAILQTRMATAYSIDRFSFLQGATVEFKVIENPKTKSE